MQRQLNNELNRYLPGTPSSGQKKQQTLYSKFSTIEQIAKSLEIQKENFDQQVQSFHHRMNVCDNLQAKAKYLNQQLYEKIYDIQFGIGNSLSEQSSSFFEDLPQIPLTQIFYDLKKKPQYQKSVKNQDIQFLSKEIQELQKQCAGLYCLQTQKLQNFSYDLLQQFDKVNQNLSKGPAKYQQKDLRLKIMKDEQTLKSKIKVWENSLNEKFQEKMLKLIEKLQNSL